MTDTLESLPAGEKTCPNCRITKPVAAYGANKRRADGMMFYCQDCTRAKHQAWVKANPERDAAHQRTYYEKHKAKKHASCVRIRKYRIALLVEQFKTKPCMDCGKSYPTYVMDFDHRPGTEKKFNLAGTRLDRYSLETTLDEIAKCDLVCSNCHRMRTHKRMKGC